MLRKSGIRSGHTVMLSKSASLEDRSQFCLLWGCLIQSVLFYVLQWQCGAQDSIKEPMLWNFLIQSHHRTLLRWRTWAQDRINETNLLWNPGNGRGYQLVLRWQCPTPDHTPNADMRRACIETSCYLTIVISEVL